MHLCITWNLCNEYKHLDLRVIKKEREFFSFDVNQKEQKPSEHTVAQRTRVNVSAVSAYFSPVKGFHLSYLLLNSYYALQTALSYDSRNEIHCFSSYVRALQLLL